MAELRYASDKSNCSLCGQGTCLRSVVVCRHLHRFAWTLSSTVILNALYYRIKYTLHIP
jgi:hypothetical protein